MYQLPSKRQSALWSCLIKGSILVKLNTPPPASTAKCRALVQLRRADWHWTSM